MGGAMDSHPIGCAALVRYGALANLIVENHGAASDGIEACVAEAGDGVAQRDVGFSGERENLRGRQAV